MKTLDYIIVGFMICSVILGCFYFYQRNVQECTKNPLVYGAALYEKNYNVEAFGSLTLLPKANNSIATVVTFTSEGHKIKQGG